MRTRRALGGVGSPPWRVIGYSVPTNAPKIQTAAIILEVIRVIRHDANR